MAPLPSGTVTILFTDVARSTELVKRLGERYGKVLAEHRRLLRAGSRSTAASRSTHRAMRSSSSSGTHELRSRPQRRSARRWPHIRGPTTHRCPSAWACTPASRTAPRAATPVSPCTGQPASAAPRMADKCCSRLDGRRSWTTSWFPASRCATWASIGSRTSSDRSGSFSSWSKDWRATSRRRCPHRLRSRVR